jgi:hypothetical protein
MPVEVKGLDATLKALRAFEPEMAKNLNKEVRAALTPVTKKAQGFVPGDISGLSNWGFSNKGKKITARSSAFAQVGRFPKFNSSIVRRGLKISLSKTRPNRSGFSTFYRISNITAAGAIMETAGRKSGSAGQPWNPASSSHDVSHSLNPNAGAWFIAHMPQSLSGSGKKRGSLLYKAYDQDKGKALAKTLKALDTTIAEFKLKSKASSGTMYR